MDNTDNNAEDEVCTVDAAVQAVVDKHLEGSDEYGPLIEDIIELVEEPYAAIEELNAVVKKLKASVEKLKIELKAAKMVPKANMVPKVVKKLTKSGKTRQQNNYSKFVGVLKNLKPEAREAQSELANYKVTVERNFRDDKSKCAMRYDSFQAELVHKGKQIIGETITFAQLYDVFVEAKGLDVAFGNGMTRAGLMWGLISEEARHEIVAQGVLIEEEARLKA